MTVILFRGSTVGQHERFPQIEHKKRDIQAELRSFRVTKRAGEASMAYEGLARLYTPESLEKFKKQGIAIQLHDPFKGETKYIIDAGDLILAYGPGPNGDGISKHFSTFKREGEELLFANYQRLTMLEQFLSDDRIWQPLSEKIEGLLPTNAKDKQ